MPCLRRRFAYLLAGALLASAAGAAGANETSFPFGSELILDVAPMPGSKRIPMIEIEDNGTASIDLWCASVEGQANVADDTITIVAAAVPQAQCTPERQSRDDNLMAALSQVTKWRRNGEVIELFGATTLRFRLLTN